MCVQMAELCDGKVIFFSENPDSDIIKNHLSTNGRAVLVGKQQITLKSGKLDQKSIPVPRHSEANSASPWKTMNLGAAIAAAWALDIPFNVIEAGAETFAPDATTATGA
jgi:cyanophycin synthetase